MLRWLLVGSPSVIGTYLTDWPASRRQHAERVTAQLLLGACGPVRIVGHRPTEALLRERDQRARQMSGSPRGKVLSMGRLT